MEKREVYFPEKPTKVPVEIILAPKPLGELSERMRKGSVQFSGNGKLFARWISEVIQLQERIKTLQEAAQDTADQGYPTRKLYDALNTD